MLWFSGTVFTLLGLAMGSFINVMADRLPADKSLLFPPSHCDSCGRKLAPWDLVPVLSFIAAKGRCRYCGAKIPWRVVVVEAAAGLLFFFAYYYYGVGSEFARVVIYGLLFLLISVIDLERQLILNKVIYPALPLALAIGFVLPGPAPLPGLIGGAVGMSLLLLVYLVSRGGMGMGDVKLAALIGLVLGFPQVLIALFLGIILGGLTAGVLLISGAKKRKEAIPFGPFLSMAAFIGIIWGRDILAWYLTRF